MAQPLKARLKTKSIINIPLNKYLRIILNLKCVFFFSKAYLIRLSGLNKMMYQSCLKSFECLLGLNSNVGIRDLAVQFSCTEAVNLAAEILQRYV